MKALNILIVDDSAVRNMVRRVFDLTELEGPLVRRHGQAPSKDWLVQLRNGLPLGLAVAIEE